ncbi:MAG: TetR/AcrR family transcriptional regulator [Solirubrobacteraceae bacterium]
MASPSPRRLPPDERRRQLVGIGLRMLTERPITEITVDDVAREAGISRSLLFNYFPTKRDYHLAIIRAAARRMRRVVLVSGDEGVAIILDRFLAFLQRRRDPYLSLLRGVGGADPEVAAINAQTRAELVDGVLRALGRDPSAPALRLAVGGWVALVEDIGLAWAADPAALPRDGIISLLLGTLDDLLARLD